LFGRGAVTPGHEARNARSVARLTTPDVDGRATGTTAEIARRQLAGEWRWVDDPLFV
jgi:hypothetical protein